MGIGIVEGFVFLLSSGRAQVPVCTPHRGGSVVGIGRQGTGAAVDLASARNQGIGLGSDSFSGADFGILSISLIRIWEGDPVCLGPKPTVWLQPSLLRPWFFLRTVVIVPGSLKATVSVVCVCVCLPPPPTSSPFSPFSPFRPGGSANPQLRPLASGLYGLGLGWAGIGLGWAGMNWQRASCVKSRFQGGAGHRPCLTVHAHRPRLEPVPVCPRPCPRAWPRPTVRRSPSNDVILAPHNPACYSPAHTTPTSWSTYSLPQPTTRRARFRPKAEAIQSNPPPNRREEEHGMHEHAPADKAARHLIHTPLGCEPQPACN